jgi:hypothetical protein
MPFRTKVVPLLQCWLVWHAMPARSCTRARSRDGIGNGIWPLQLSSWIATPRTPWRLIAPSIGTRSAAARCTRSAGAKRNSIASRMVIWPAPGRVVARTAAEPAQRRRSSMRILLPTRRSQRMLQTFRPLPMLVHRRKHVRRQPSRACDDCIELAHPLAPPKVGVMPGP